MSAKKNCKILSLNVRGIRDSIKRRGIFSYLKDQKASFYFLQETYSEIFRNAVLTMMDVFDLTDIQRERYPNLNEYSSVL